MSKRRKAREIALQALYAIEVTDTGWEEALADTTERRRSSSESVEYARRLVEGVVRNLDVLDGRISKLLENWELDRLSIVDKNILRIALEELIECPETPTKVIINEAIEIAARFSSSDAGRFVNGVLDSLSREVRKA